MANPVYVSPDRREEGRDAARKLAIQLGLLVLAALAIRILAWVLWPPSTIEGEGAEYARIAQNIRAGIGYVGIVVPGRELMFPPLFPWLIDLASFVSPNFEFAGRLVALILGMLLPLPVFGIASTLFGRRTGFVAAVLSVFYPLFVVLSFSVLSEGPYITLLLSAVYVTFRAMKSPSVKLWLLAGVSFGVCYLIRQEAMIPLGIAAIFAWLTAKGSPSRWKYPVAAVVAFFILALPQIVILYQGTGHFMLQGKGKINFALGEAVLKGESLGAVSGRLADGVSIVSNAEVIKNTHITPSALVPYLRAALHKDSAYFLSQFSTKLLGGPFLLALAFLGEFHRPWEKSTVPYQLFFLAVPAAAVLTTFSVVHLLYARNYFLLAAFMLICAAEGLGCIYEWAAAIVSATRYRRASHTASLVVCGLLALTFTVYCFFGVPGEFIPALRFFPVERTAGMWIRHQQNAPVRILDLPTPLSFHAHATYIHFPYCSSQQALQFIQAEHINYVILRPIEQHYSSYYDDWLAHGIPDPRAKLVYTAGSGIHEVMVYRWNQAGPSPLPQPKVARYQTSPN